MSDRDATNEEPTRGQEEAWLIAPPPPPPPPAGPADPDDTLVPLAAAGFIPPPDAPPADIPAAPPPADIPAAPPPADILAAPPPADIPAAPPPAGIPAAPPPTDTPAPRPNHKFPLTRGSSAAKSALREVKAISPWMLAAAAILVAFFVSWFAGIVLSFRHQPGFTGRDRVLQFFEPATLEWALAILLALVLLEVGRRFDPAPPVDPPDLPSGAKVRKSRLTVWLPIGLFLAAGAVCISAAVGALVELTNFGNGIDAAFSQLILYVAVLGVAAAAAWWAFKDTSKTPPA